MVTGLKAAHYTLGLAWFQLMFSPAIKAGLFLFKKVFFDGYFDVTNSLIHSY
jgi:hypothetical protein